MNRLILWVAMQMVAINIFAQNVGIGTTTPNASAALDVSSTTRGLLPPRMAAVQRNAIASPANGLMVYDTDSSAFFFWNGTMWNKLLAGGASNQWFATGNNLYNNNSGNVGIGNSNPLYKLDVSGRMQMRGGINDNNSAGLWLAGTGADSSVRKIFIGMQADSSAGFYSERFGIGWGLVFDGRSGNVGIGNQDPSFPISFKDNSGDKISLYREGSNYYGLGISNAAMQLITANSRSDILMGYGRSAAFTENMRIKGNGIVGIGESNPTNAGLVVNKKIGATHAIFGSSTTGVAIESSLPGIGFNNYFNGTRKAIATGYSAYIGVNPSSGGMQFLVSGSSVNADNTVALNTGITIAPNGNVGFGISNSNAPLQFSNVALNRKIVLYESANNDHQFYGFGINGSALRYQTSGSVDDHVFFSGINSTSSKELLRIKGNGNVGIGITDPAFLLDLGGRLRIRFAQGESAGIWLNNDANTESSAFLGMRTNDEVGIYGQTGTPNWRFYVNTSTGNATLQGVLTQNSDARLKKDIQPLQSALENIETISGYQYHWKEEGRDSAQQIGLLAQEVQKIYPQLVKEDSNGTLSVNYSGMVPVLLEAIKEQQKQIDEMKKAIQLLQEK